MKKKHVSVSDLNKSAAFTGYRSYKLPYGRNLEDPIAITLRNALYRECERLVTEHGFRYFLTGGAEGSDLMMAEIVLELKRKYRDLHIGHFLCLPCKNHDKSWCAEDKERLSRIMNKSVVQYINEGEYTRGCMQKRNMYMVNTSCVLLAVYDGKSGGTKNTIEYARKCGRKIITFRPENPVTRIEEYVSPDDYNWSQITLDEPSGVYLVNRFGGDKNFNSSDNDNNDKDNHKKRKKGFYLS